MSEHRFLEFFILNLSNLDFTKGEWMILATTNKLLKEFSEHFYRTGLRIFGKNNSILPNSVLEAYRFWIKLNNGELIATEDAKKIWDYLHYNKGHVKYGSSSGKTLIGDEMVSLNILKKVLWRVW